MPTQPTTNELEPLDQAQKTPQEILAGLAAMALAGGSSEKAAARLHAAGLSLHPRTLRDWRHRYPQRYAKACQEHAPLIEAGVVHLHREIASQSAEAVLKAIRIENRRLDHGKVENAARSAKDLSTAAAIAVDKVLLLTDRPNKITEERTPEHAMKRLRSLHPGLFVDGTAEEITPDEAVQPQAQVPALPRVTGGQPRETAA